MIKRTGFCFLLILSIALPAAADPFPVLPSGVSDWLFVLNPDGSFFKGVWATETDEVTNGALFIYRIPDATIANDPANVGLTILVETDSNGNPIPAAILTNHWIISDFVEIDTDATTQLHYIGFQSGEPETLGEIPVNFPGTFPETTTPFNVTAYLNADLQARGYTAWFGSDIAPPGSAVPEPTSLLLLGTGLGGLAIAARRKRK